MTDRLQAENLTPQAALSDERLHAVLAFIESSISQPVTVAQIAATVRLSPFHFARSFKKSVGRGPHSFLMLRRIERAKALIAGGGLPLKSVATAVGYNSQSHFTRVFAKYVGMTPGDYRDMVFRRYQEYRVTDQRVASYVASREMSFYP